MIHDMYLVEVKKPAESKEPWDYYHVKQVIPAPRPSSRWRCRVAPRGEEVIRRAPVAGDVRMTEIFGVPIQALFGQLMLGLVNGSFYAVLSLGLAVIFGMLNIINFAHGALYMMGAMLAWIGLEYFGIGYWWSLLLAPLGVGLIGIAIERLMLQWLYKLDHLYGLLLTFGLALMIEGLFRDLYGVAGQPYSIPEELRGPSTSASCSCPSIAPGSSSPRCRSASLTWYMIEKTRLGAYLRAATENPKLTQAFGINVPLMVMLTYGFRRRPGRFRRRAGRAGLPGRPADGLQPDHRRLRRGGDRRHGFDPRFGGHGPGPGHHRGHDQGVLAGSQCHRGVHDHGGGADDPSGRPVREREMSRRVSIAYLIGSACCCWRRCSSIRSW
jgi:hypothetical protein